MGEISSHRTYYSRCPACDCEVQVSDWKDGPAGESPGRFFLIHALFLARCTGSSERAYGWWLKGALGPEGFMVPGEEAG